MVEYKREDKKDEINRYRGFGYARRVHKLKEDYIKEYKALTGERQEGLKIHFEFYYLLNTDVNWIVKKVREAMLEVIKEQIEDKEYFEKRKHRTILTCDILPAINGGASCSR